MEKFINMTKDGESLGFPKTPESEIVDIGIFKGDVINFIKRIFIKAKKHKKGS